MTLALLPSVKMTITRSLTANAEAFHWRFLHTVGVPPTPNLEAYGGGPVRVPLLAFFHSKTSLVVPETARSQLQENCVDTQ